MELEEPIAIDDSNFDQIVLQSEKPVVVDFWATWCRPSLIATRLLEQLAEEYAGRITIAKLDVEHNMKTAKKYGVMGIPNVVIFKNRKLVSQICFPSIAHYLCIAEFKRQLDAVCS